MLKREAVKQSNQVKVTFVLPHNPDQPRISVVGDFNNWNPTANPLIKRPNNTRSASLTLDPGQRYNFRYYLADGSAFQLTGNGLAIAQATRPSSVSLSAVHPVMAAKGRSFGARLARFWSSLYAPHARPTAVSL